MGTYDLQARDRGKLTHHQPSPGRLGAAGMRSDCSRPTKIFAPATKPSRANGRRLSNQIDATIALKTTIARIRRDLTNRLHPEGPLPRRSAENSPAAAAS